MRTALLGFIWRGITALALLYATVTGMFEVLAAVQLRKEIEGEWLLGLSGIASVVFGALLVGFRGAGALALDYRWPIRSFLDLVDVPRL